MQQPDRARVHDLLAQRLALRPDDVSIHAPHLQDNDRVQRARAGDADVAAAELELLLDGEVIVRTGVDRGTLQILELDRLGQRFHPHHHAHVGDDRVHVGHVEGTHVGPTGGDGCAVGHIAMRPEGWVEVLVERRET